MSYKYVSIEEVEGVRKVKWDGQLVSRFTSILRIPDPTIKDLIAILSFPQGVLSAYNQILSQSNLIITISDAAKLLIAENAYETRSFARGMKRTVSRIIEDIVYADIKGKVNITPADVLAVLDNGCDVPDEPRPTISNSVATDAEPCSIYGG